MKRDGGDLFNEPVEDLLQNPGVNEGRGGTECADMTGKSGAVPHVVLVKEGKDVRHGYSRLYSKYYLDVSGVCARACSSIHGDCEETEMRGSRGPDVSLALEARVDHCKPTGFDKGSGTIQVDPEPPVYKLGAEA